MMLKIEKTNNETILKFVSETMLTKGSFEYNNVDEASNSSLVQQLFYLPFVKKRNALTWANALTMARPPL